MISREVAWRVFAGEYSSSNFEIKGEGERAPSYIVTPIGAMINRVFLVGVLTDLDNIGTGEEPLWRARLSDPTGTFYVSSGQYQPEATATLRARFVQTKVFEALSEEDTSAGVLYYRKPDAVRWQYTAPDSSWTVLRGGKGWSVFPRIRQVQKFDLQQSQAEAVLSIVGFGACGKDLERAFEIGLSTGDDGLQVLAMKPREPEIAARFERIDLGLDPGDHLPRRVVLHESSGNTVRFEFHDLERGATIRDELFEYAVPKGYEVVE